MARQRTPVAACAATPLEPDVIEALLPQGDIKLASGRIAVLDGVRLADGKHRDRALAWLRTHVGAPVAVAPRRRSPDRWGRVSASIVRVDRPIRLDLAHGLVDLGLAVADAGEADAFCAPELFAIEDAARLQGLGVWTAGGYMPAPADDAARLRALAGRFALVEGRVRSVGERQSRTYLNFGADWTNDFAIVIPKRTWAALRDRGVSAGMLNGRRVRSRGVIEVRRGPIMEVQIADMLEILDQERVRR